MFHFLWYLLVGLIAGVIAKSAMHVHISLLWTIVLGIIGSILVERLRTCFHVPPTNGSIQPG